MPNRADALAEQIRQILSQAILFDMRDPALEGITITRVRVSRDLAVADVRFTPQDDIRDPALVASSLQKASGAFRSLLAKRLELRRTPQLRFHFDEDVVAERRISDLLDNLIPREDDDD